MDISVVVIGDELLLGRVADTNSGFIARAVEPLGWHVRHIETVGDDAVQMQHAIERALAMSQIVITTGGLGPTRDDITKGVLCSIFGGGLHRDDTVLENVRRIMTSRGRELNQLTCTQADVPDSCRVIQNLVGTAPILWFERDGKVLVAMPGVPHETERMLVEAVIPQLIAHFGQDGEVFHRSLLVADLSESRIAEMLVEAENAFPPGTHLAYLPQLGYVHLRVDSDSLRNADCAIAEIARVLGTHIIYNEDVPLARALLSRLAEKNLTVSTAESCTGGNIAHEITLIPGSSASMNGGVVAYSNAVKRSLLGVDAKVLEKFGAVSIPVVEQMASGAARACGSDVAIATSGIAGPGGGTPGKPVGMVCIAVYCCGKVTSHIYHFAGERKRVISYATNAALVFALRVLDGCDRE